jgi:TRAP-type C4-dicarboxylate transport system permease small subunit
MPGFVNSIVALTNRANSSLKSVEKAGAAVCAVSIFVMVGLTTADVILRYLFNSPITGAYEIMEFLPVGVAFLSFAYVQRTRGHVGLEIVVPRLPRKAALILEIVGCILALGCLWAAAWQSGGEAWDAFVTGDYMGEIVRVPYWPAKSVVALGFGLLCLTLISIIVHDLVELKK